MDKYVYIYIHEYAIMVYYYYGILGFSPLYRALSSVCSIADQTRIFIEVIPIP